ncbi:hypothetical protein E4U55_000369 [Claviceps digitariae]|nr:hypothetical protein E4U55_000369 [Claviceps digitariae]
MEQTLAGTHVRDACEWASRRGVLKPAAVESVGSGDSMGTMTDDKVAGEHNGAWPSSVARRLEETMVRSKIGQHGKPATHAVSRPSIHVGRGCMGRRSGVPDSISRAARRSELRSRATRVSYETGGRGEDER